MSIVVSINERGTLTLPKAVRTKLGLTSAGQVLLDCDEDTVLFKVRREGEGNVCHLNRVSCFCTYVENAEVGERR